MSTALDLVAADDALLHALISHGDRAGATEAAKSERDETTALAKQFPTNVRVSRAVLRGSH